MEKKTLAEKSADLRRRAEKALQDRSIDLPASLGELSSEQVQRLFHDLRVHQIELEMQNDELRRAQQELEASRDSYVDLYDFSPVGYITLSEQSLILEANLTIASLLGVARGDLIKKSLRRFIVGEDQDIYYFHRQQLFETREPQVCELRMVKNDGVPSEWPSREEDGVQFWARIEAVVAQDSEGQPICRATVSDVSGQKRAEETLRQSNRRLEETLAELRDTQEQMVRQERLAAVGQLSAGIAHDFRTLLTTIILYAQLALRQPGLAPKLARNIKIIIGESQKAADLVQQILDFSRRSILQVRVLDLPSLVQNTMNILQRTIPGNVRLSLEVEPGQQAAAFLVRADSGRIQQLLTNLATNARDAMPRGGKLCFELSHVTVAEDGPPLANIAPPLTGGKWVCLAVSDTGTGMTEEVRAHLFEPFFTTKDVDKGTGLGLAQVHGIVRQHEGSIGVETELGRGTTFFIYLPAYEADSDRAPVADSDRASVKESKAQESPALPQGQGETILLVEDNEDLRKAGQNILESLGYRVLTAANGREALTVYETGGSVDLVITDVVMPEMGGKELVQELRRSDPDLKVLAITGYVADEIVQELREVGFLDVISKPFAIETLARVIRRALSVSTGRWI